MNFQEFAKEIKVKRLMKNWYTFVGIVDVHKIELKGYKTWLQIYRVDGLNYGGMMEISIADFNKALERPFFGDR